MENRNERKELDLDTMEKVVGGYIVDDPEENRFWIVKDDGTVLGPAPNKEAAIEFAKAFDASPAVLTMAEYKALFGKDLIW